MTKNEERRSCKESKRKEKRERGTAAVCPEGAGITTITRSLHYHIIYLHVGMEPSTHSIDIAFYCKITNAL